MTLLRNFTFDELKLGQIGEYQRQVTERDVILFAAASGDVNPLHLDAQYAARTEFGERIAHGMLGGAFVSAAIALVLPGPGTVYLEQNLRFKLPVRLGDQICVRLEVTELIPRRHYVKLDCKVTNQDQKTVIQGNATVIAPTEKQQLESPTLPDIGI